MRFVPLPGSSHPMSLSSLLRTDLHMCCPPRSPGSPLSRWPPATLPAVPLTSSQGPDPVTVSHAWQRALKLQPTGRGWGVCSPGAEDILGDLGGPAKLPVARVEGQSSEAVRMRRPSEAAGGSIGHSWP